MSALRLTNHIRRWLGLPMIARLPRHVSTIDNWGISSRVVRRKIADLQMGCDWKRAHGEAVL